MQFSIRFAKRLALAGLTVAVALTWTQTGRAQLAPCLVERGQDPLDILNSGVRHNVWVILDISGSMRATFNNSVDTRTKLDVARDVIKQLMGELVDGAGRSLVNWAFVPYGRQIKDGIKCPAVPPDVNGDNYPDTPDGCHGLLDSAYVNPPECGDDSRAQIETVLDGLSAAGGTPIGVAFTDIASYLVGQHVVDDPTSGTAPTNTTNFVTGLLPNQKNFVVHVTDGQDTCECEQGGYPPVSTDSLVDPIFMRPDQSDPNLTVPSSDGGDRASYNAGLKGEFALRQIDPALDGSKGNIFTIGMDLDPDDKDKINTIAWMAAGANMVPQRDRDLMNPAFFADSPEQLVKAFKDVFARIGIPESTITLGAPIVTSVKEVIASHTNTSLLRQEVIPIDVSDAEAIRQARQVRADHQNNVLFNTAVDIPSFRGHLRAINIYTVTDPTQPRTERAADFTELWDAGVELQDDDPDNRLIFFNRRDSDTLVPFDTTNVDPTDLGVARGYLSDIDGVGALSDDDARDIVVQVMRGYRLSIDPATQRIYKLDGTLNLSKVDENGDPTWKLYEAVAAVAVISNPPRSPDFDPPLNHASEYGVGGAVDGDGFYWDNINRKTIVAYPSNAGIMHFFDAETGAELAGYIPDDVLGLDEAVEVPGSRGTLKDFVRLVVANNNSVINHVFTLAGPPTVADGFLRDNFGGDNAWHTLLAFGRGRGGRFVSLLDITDLAFDPNLMKLRWNKGNREGVADGPLDGLGETWSTPVIGNVDARLTPSTADTDVDQLLVFAGGGYGCDNADNEGQFLFAFRAEDGMVYFRGQAPDDASAVISYNALPARPTLFIPHQQDLADSKDFVTRVYIPDVQGRVLKLDTFDPDPANWTFNVFAEMGTEHPITAPVEILNDSFDPNRVFVIAGSGGDRRAPVPVEGFRLRVWEDNDPDGSNTTQYASSDTGAFEQVFNPDERMFVQAVTIGKIGDVVPPAALFVASSESLDTTICEISFQSTLYGVTIASGFPQYDLGGPTPGPLDLGGGKAQGGTTQGGPFTVTMSGGRGVDGRVDIYGGSDTFDDEPAPGGFGNFTLQLVTEGFRIAPF